MKLTLKKIDWSPHLPIDNKRTECEEQTIVTGRTILGDYYISYYFHFSRNYTLYFESQIPLPSFPHQVGNYASISDAQAGAALHYCAYTQNLIFNITDPHKDLKLRIKK
jgi:hypothetical protein